MMGISSIPHCASFIGNVMFQKALTLLKSIFYVQKEVTWIHLELNNKASTALKRNIIYFIKRCCLVTNIGPDI